MKRLREMVLALNAWRLGTIWDDELAAKRAEWERNRLPKVQVPAFLLAWMIAIVVGAYREEYYEPILKALTAADFEQADALLRSQLPS